MSLATYIDLQAAIQSWLKRADIANFTGDLITLGETWIYRHARAREMEASLSVAVSSGTAAVPADFIALKTARITGDTNTRLEIRPADWIYDNYPVRSGGGSLPKFIAVEGSSFIFGPFPGTYTVIGTYYKTLGALSSSNHALFAANPDLYLFAALGEAEAFLKGDQRVALWLEKRDRILIDVNREAQESRFGDGMATRAA